MCVLALVIIFQRVAVCVLCIMSFVIDKILLCHSGKWDVHWSLLRMRFRGRRVQDQKKVHV